jgi:hypothetical protein
LKLVRQYEVPFGTFDVTGRPIEWTSQVFFRFKGGKIAEMRVARDELGSSFPGDSSRSATIYLIAISAIAGAAQLLTCY